MISSTTSTVSWVVMYYDYINTTHNAVPIAVVMSYYRDVDKSEAEDYAKSYMKSNSKNGLAFVAKMFGRANQSAGSTAVVTVEGWNHDTLPGMCVPIDVYVADSEPDNGFSRGRHVDTSIDRASGQFDSYCTEGMSFIDVTCFTQYEYKDVPVVRL